MAYTLSQIKNDAHLAEILALTVEWIVNDVSQPSAAQRLVDEYQLPPDTARAIANVAAQFLREQADISDEQ